MERLDLKAVDVDGALQETAAAAQAGTEGHTRSAFLRRAGVAGGALAVSGGVLGGIAAGAGAKSYSERPPKSYGKGDIGILNFALVLEYLEAAFYNEAQRAGAITDPATQAFLQTVVRDENAHVAFLQKGLGAAAVPMPSFDFQGVPEDQTKFQQTAYALENTGVHAYLGQISNIASPVYVTDAAQIAIVEGRHAAVIGAILDDSPSGIAPFGPFDEPENANKILNTVAATGFVTGGLPPSN
jgi:hypothetical protein